MAKIAVVGMGQGGMVSAVKLAQGGHDVTVYEQAERGAVSYDWTDDIRSDIFKLCDLPMPDESIYSQKNKWLFVSPDQKHSLPFPPCPPMEEISIYRRGFSEYFANLAESAGCKLVFGKRITKLVIENDFVVGVEVDGEKCAYDLVIDASGMCSALRAQLPEKFGVQAMPEAEGVMYGYRAFFKRVEGAETVVKGLDSTVILKHLGSKGISWCNVTRDNNVDVLIGRVGCLSDDEIKSALADLKKFNAILSDEMISEKRVKICLRASIARAVADGYVAIGDSAYMTMPLLGSGIEASMSAGKAFANYVNENKITKFSAENLWGYYANYMRTKAADFALIDVLKRWALAVNPKRIDWLFGCGIESALAAVSTDENAKLKISPKTICKILAKPSFVFEALGCVTRALKAKKCAQKVPKKYNAKKLAKWQKKYEKRLGN